MKQEKEPSKIAFDEICQLVEQNDWELEECVLENAHNRKRQTVTTFTIYFLDRRGNSIQKIYKMIDEQYLWLSCDLSRKFPKATVIDARKFKPSKR